MMLDDISLPCPYCGEPNDIVVDPSGGKRQFYQEDCQVCCRPWNVSVRLDADGDVQVRLAAADDVEGNE
ncbi:MAG: CPXCG motif-containing cysteine-rich protein [bacterium]